MKKLFFLAIIMVSIAACSAKLSADRGWANQRWVLVEMKGVPVQQSGGRNDAFIRFEPLDKTFNGNAGCNQMSGKYILDGKELEFRDVITTKMACTDIDFETTFLSVLGSIEKYEMNGTDIRLKRNRETLLVFRPR